MFKTERRLTIFFSLLLLALIIHFFDISIMISLYFISIPFFVVTAILIQRREDRREGLRLSISRCMEESDFNAVDGMEQLKDYFLDTGDITSYISAVDSRVLTYIFDNENSKLKYSDYIKGLTLCLASFKDYDGLINYNIKCRKVSGQERIKSALNILYLVAKHMDSCSSIINIDIKKALNLSFEITDQSNEFYGIDPFSEKLQLILEA